MSRRYHLVTIGGEEYRLRYGRAPLIDAQTKAGKTVGQIFGALVILDLEAMQVLLWAALRTENPTTSYNQAGEILDQWMEETHLVEIQEALNEAAVASGLLVRDRIEEDEEDEESAPKASGSGQTK